MHKNDNLYCFSPTGGTLKVAEALHNQLKNKTDITVVAAPVYGGRIPALVVEELSKLEGKGRKAVALVVYGVRAYDDALLELTDTLKAQGFQVIAAGAFVARHSIVPEVGMGRPNEQDIADIETFAQKILDKLEQVKDAEMDTLQIPGNYPYRDRSKVAATPITPSECVQCGSCINVCPTGAIKMENGTVATDLEKCILCMACVWACPQKMRALPPQMQEGMEQKLGPLKEVQRENEYFV